MKSLTGFASLWMEGNLKEIETFLEGNFAEKKEIGRKSYVPKVEALFTPEVGLNIFRENSAKERGKNTHKMPITWEEPLLRRF